MYHVIENSEVVDKFVNDMATTAMDEYWPEFHMGTEDYEMIHSKVVDLFDEALVAAINAIEDLKADGESTDMEDDTFDTPESESSETEEIEYHNTKAHN